jgi:hypothetical protein
MHSDMPVLADFCGTWAPDASSDSLDDLFAAMGVAWLARKIVSSIGIQTKIYQTKDVVLITDTSSLGSFTLHLVPDGKWRPVMQLDRSPAMMRCKLNDREAGADSGQLLCIETAFPNGLLVDHRVLASRATIKQTTGFHAGRGEAEAWVHPRKGATRFIRRTLTRVETPEEAAAAEAMEADARRLLAHQAAALALHSGATVIDFRDQHDKEEVGSEEALETSSPFAAASAPTPTAATAGAASADFTGLWVVDKARSESLEEMLKLMGLGYLMRKMAVSIEVISVMTHDLTRGVLVCEDRSSVMTATTTGWFDGQPHDVKGSDGKTAVLTCQYLYPPPPADHVRGWNAADAIGGYRVLCVLPDSLGETTDTRWLIHRGNTMAQCLVFTRGGSGPDAGRRTVTYRFFENKDWTEDKAQMPRPLPVTSPSGEGSTPVAAPTRVGTSGAPAVPTRVGTSGAPATEGAEAANLLAVSLPAGAAPARDKRLRTSSATSARSSGSAGTEAPGLDPFFVSISGTWQIDYFHSESLDPLWKSIGIMWLIRWLVTAVDITTQIRHTKAEITMADTSKLGTHTSTTPLNGAWVPVRQASGAWMLSRAVQRKGSGDLGPRWLGSYGFLPTIWLKTDDDIAGGDDVSTPSSSPLPSRSASPLHAGVGRISRHSSMAGASGATAATSISAAHDGVGSGSVAFMPRGTRFSGPTVPSPAVEAYAASAAARQRGSGASVPDPESSLAEEAHKAPSLAQLPVNASDFSSCEIVIETVLADVSGRLKQLQDVAKLSDESASLSMSRSSPASPASNASAVMLPLASRLRLTLMATSPCDVLHQTFEHIDVNGAVLLTVRRVLTRKTTSRTQVRVAETLESARIQHACALMTARLAAAEQSRRAYRRHAATEEPAIQVLYACSLPSSLCHTHFASHLYVECTHGCGHGCC